MNTKEKELKATATAALTELQAITTAMSTIMSPERAVLQGLTEAFELGYAVGYTSGRATITTLAETVAGMLKP